MSRDGKSMMDQHAGDTTLVDAAAIVVAGGRGRRMGPLGPGGKAAIEVGGRRLLERVIDSLSAVVPRIVIIAGDACDGLREDMSRGRQRLGEQAPQSVASEAGLIEFIHDSQPGAGPLVAIADGLRYLRRSAAGRAGIAPPERCFLAACDLPWLRPQVVRFLLDACRDRTAWVVPRVHGHLQVLASAMTTESLTTIDRYLDDGRRDPTGLCGHLSTRIIEAAELTAIDPNLASFIDIDTPQDLLHAGAMTRTTYGACIDPFVTDRLPSLDAGTPVPGAATTLLGLSPESLFADEHVTNVSAATCCLAGLLLWNDCLEESHAISQQIESPEGSYWHSIMHRREGDYGNAKYWLRRVGRHVIESKIGIAAARLTAEVAPSEPLDDSTRWLSTAAAWDPCRFVDLCEAVVQRRSPHERLARLVAAAEWHLLFSHSRLEAIRRRGPESSAV